MRYKETTLEKQNIRLERDMIDQLNKYSKTYGVSKSLVIRRAVRQYLNMNQG